MDIGRDISFLLHTPLNSNIFRSTLKSLKERRGLLF